MEVASTSKPVERDDTLQNIRAGGNSAWGAPESRLAALEHAAPRRRSASGHEWAAASQRDDGNPRITHKLSGEPTIAKPRPKSALGKVSFRHNREERLALLDTRDAVFGIIARRRQKQAVELLQDRKRECEELAKESFLRQVEEHDDDDEDIQQALLEALADCGIKARTGRERLALNTEIQRLCDHDDGVDLPGFIRLIEACRDALLVVLSEPIFSAWKCVDTQSVGTIARSDCVRILAALNLAPPRSDTEASRVATLLAALPCSEAGRVSLPQAELFMLQVREWREAQYRKVERLLSEDHIDLRAIQGHSSEKTARMYETLEELKGSRGHMVEMYEAFRYSDKDGSGELSMEEILCLLADFGILRGGSDRAKGIEIIEEIRGEGKEEIDFGTYLLILKTLRTVERKRRQPELVRLFGKHDVGSTGELTLDHLRQFLVDLDLLPESRRQQDGFARVLDEADADGSGTFKLEEVQTIVEQVGEGLLMDQRAYETEQGRALGFDKLMVHRLRGLFDEMDTDDSASLTIEEIGKAVKKLGWTIKRGAIEKFIGEADMDMDSTLGFEEFLKFMWQLKDFCKPRNVSEEHTSNAVTATISILQYRRMVTFDQVQDTVASEGSMTARKSIVGGPSGATMANAIKKFKGYV